MWPNVNSASRADQSLSSGASDARQRLDARRSTRFTYQGEPIYYMGTSTFSEYTVVAEVSPKYLEANPEKTCYLLWRNHRLRLDQNLSGERGDNIAVFGLGAIGLAPQGAVKQVRTKSLPSILTKIVLNWLVRWGQPTY